MQNSTYLESKVLTAPPQRLQLMLIEGAIRFGRQAEEALRRGEPTTAAAPLLRVIDIVGELLAAAREKESDLNQRVADFYLFLFRRVSEAKINSDPAPLAEALQLLDYERETWQLVCDKLASGEGVPRPKSFDSSKSQATHQSMSWEA
ncbi:MAG: flagellar export chaperone FliS [Pirellulales bacterium]